MLEVLLLRWFGAELYGEIKHATLNGEWLIKMYVENIKRVNSHKAK